MQRLKRYDYATCATAFLLACFCGCNTTSRSSQTSVPRYLTAAETAVGKQVAVLPERAPTPQASATMPAMASQVVPATAASAPNQLVAWQEEVPAMPAVPAESQALSPNASNALTLEEVLRSASQSYPLLEIAIAQLAEADGNALAAWGNMDSVLSGYTISKPLGFFENYRNGAKLSRPLWNGGEVYGAYRIGRGVYEPWYLERQTNEGGEFKTGVKLPFLKGYAIDGRRAAIATAALERSRLGPDVTSQIIGMQLLASQLYWKWVAAGQAVRTQAQLLSLAEVRNANLIKRVEAEDLPKITEIDNGRFIAKRQAKLIESRRKVQEAAIKLSLFYRDANGHPIVVSEDRLPTMFPASQPVDPNAVESDVLRAFSQRPELLALEFQRQQTSVLLQYAQNQMLPKLDGFAETGQDVGEPTSSTRDKSELEIEVGLIAEVPLQRRAALGKIQATQSKLAQINAKQRFIEDKIRSQVQDAVSALTNAYQRILQARENLRLSRQSLSLGKVRFDAGDIDLIQLNIYETSLADAELLLIAAEFDYFASLAEYRAALALDPLNGVSDAIPPPLVEAPQP